MAGAVDYTADADRDPFELDRNSQATTCLLRLPSDSPVSDDGRVRVTRSVAVLPVLRSIAGTDVLPDRNLGWRATRLCRDKVFHLHRRGQLVDACCHYHAVFHVSHV